MKTPAELELDDVTNIRWWVDIFDYIAMTLSQVTLELYSKSESYNVL